MNNPTDKGLPTEGKGIKLGSKVIVDRGSLGSWFGKIIELHNYGWALGIDCYGVIETDLGETHSFDTCVHKLSIL